MAHITSLTTVLIIVQITVQVYGEVVRKDNEWVIPPRQLLENKDYTKERYIAKIRSDEDLNTTVRYSLHGQGSTEPPFNLFTVEAMTGYVRVNHILDREKMDFYHLRGQAWFPDGTRAEPEIVLVIEVLDENDCAPVFFFEFESQAIGSVYETSAEATLVMKVNATDADQADTLHSQIMYTIVDQSPAKGGSMFYISQSTGEIYVKQNTLDRETDDTYSLTIKGTDMNGGAGGLSGTGKIEVKILDVNDNIPTLEMDNYVTTVMENRFNVTVLRIKALDADLIYSDNWLAVFTIVSGNEEGSFSITTDTKTNEGILVLNKTLSFAELKVIDMLIVVFNKAEYHSSTIITETKYYPIKIHVQKEPSGPRFQPAIKVVQVSEAHTTINIKQALTTYRAIDTDTLQYATNVIYAKGEDKENWIIVDQHTAQIHLIQVPDRESKYLVDGTYYVKIICISKDLSEKTATGTIAIQVEDINDNCPTLTSTSQTLCYDDNVVYVTAVDGDAYPNAAPFEFLIKQNTNEWTVESLNDTSAILRPIESLWPGLYRVVLVIRDQQGEACADDQVIDVQVCSCTDARACVLETRSRPTASMGPVGMLTLLLGLLTLFLLSLLLPFCLCGVIAEEFKPVPWEAKQRLIPYNTEGQGEDKEVPWLLIPTKVDGGSVSVTNGTVTGVGLGGNTSSLHYKGTNTNTKEYEFQQWSSQEHSSHGRWAKQVFEGQYKPTQSLPQPFAPLVKPTLPDPDQVQVPGQTCEFEEEWDIALSDEFLEEYYSQKASWFIELHSIEDSLLIHDNEDPESAVEFTDCCSLLEDEQDLHFLNDLSLEFKNLATICCGEIFEVETSKDMTNLNLSEKISQSVVTAKAEATSLATSSSLIQSSITSAIQSSVVSSSQLHEITDVSNQTQLIQQPTLLYTATPPGTLHQPTLLISLTIKGMENLDRTQSLLSLEGRAPSDPQQVIDMLGSREVVVVKTQDGMENRSVEQMSHSETLISGNVSTVEKQWVGSEQFEKQWVGSEQFEKQWVGERMNEVVPSQIHSGMNVEVNGQNLSWNVPLETVHEGAHKIVVQEREEKVSVTEQNLVQFCPI